MRVLGRATSLTLTKPFFTEAESHRVRLQQHSTAEAKHAQQTGHSLRHGLAHRLNKQNIHICLPTWCINIHWGFFNKNIIRIFLKSK